MAQFIELPVTVLCVKDDEANEWSKPESKEQPSVLAINIDFIGYFFPTANPDDGDDYVEQTIVRFTTGIQYTANGNQYHQCYVDMTYAAFTAYLEHAKRYTEQSTVYYERYLGMIEKSNKIRQNSLFP